MTEQPKELREYLVEAEAIAREWYSREGLEETHERNIDTLATLTGLTWMTGGARQFGELRDVARTGGFFESWKAPTPQWRLILLSS